VPREHKFLTDFPNFGCKEPRFEQKLPFSRLFKKGHFKMAASLLYYSTDRIVCESANSDGFYFSESGMTKRKNSLTSSSLAIDIDPTLYWTVHCAHALLYWVLIPVATKIFERIRNILPGGSLMLPENLKYNQHFPMWTPYLIVWVFLAAEAGWSLAAISSKYSKIPFHLYNLNISKVADSDILHWMWVH